MAQRRQKRRLRVGVIYKITYPNGKIYIGQDRTNDVNYFGSADSFTISKDFSEQERLDFTVRKEVLSMLPRCTIKELSAEERKQIIAFRSSDPSIGYNRTHQPRKKCTTVWL